MQPKNTPPQKKILQNIHFSKTECKKIMFSQNKNTFSPKKIKIFTKNMFSPKTCFHKKNFVSTKKNSTEKHYSTKKSILPKNAFSQKNIFSPKNVILQKKKNIPFHHN